MGDFIVRIPLTPTEYWNLQVGERDAILEAWQRANKPS